MAKTVTGGCMCGAIRYESTGEPIAAAMCYCRDCQRSSGTAMASLLIVPKAGFKLTKGEVKLFEVTADSGGKVRRGFCENCGSPILSMLSAMSDVVGIKAGSLDDPDEFNPGVNVYMASAPEWAPVLADIARFDRMPPRP